MDDNDLLKQMVEVEFSEREYCCEGRFVPGWSVIETCEPQCKRRLVHEHMERIQFHIPREYWFANFNQFDSTGQDRHETAERQKALDVAIRYTTMFKEAHAEGFAPLFYGPFGTGKSLLASCILWRASKDGYSIKLRTFAEIMQIIKAGFREPVMENGSEVNLDREMVNTDFYCVDDIGRHTSPSHSDFADRELDRLISHRLSCNRPTIITTNLGADEVSDIANGHVMSRIGGKCVAISVPGQDFRINIQKPRLKQKLFSDTPSQGVHSSE